jgi:hypothetical protein
VHCINEFLQRNGSRIVLIKDPKHPFREEWLEKSRTNLANATTCESFRILINGKGKVDCVIMFLGTTPVRYKVATHSTHRHRTNVVQLQAESILWERNLQYPMYMWLGQLGCGGTSILKLN